ncbi:hypothetical protein Bca52824_078404 [Brassica carinata]|uniref:CDP-diacylglycerol--serine O-phosphatidyltransferase n=1 Tax=Brassica carinata TaxID=52824 RepID=A0A8X7TY53_BRACI|nr:hypothetical protein Bca52824_078404 [Brassica carinata]
MSVFQTKVGCVSDIIHTFRISKDLGWNVYNTLILMVQHMSGLSLAASLTLLASKVKRTLWQFTPVRWDKDEWHPLQATWHVIQVLTICIIFLTVALNTLFLKFSMWIPSTNPLILYSLILWLLIARAKALESDYVFDESSGYYYSSRLSRWQRL